MEFLTTIYHLDVIKVHESLPFQEALLKIFSYAGKVH
jgi:hypothetical protein